jgi:succinoglycan biosynthesis protein ExoM
MAIASTISICLCTYRRPGLIDTLDSLRQVLIPSGVEVELIIVDNDADGSARSLVESRRGKLPFPIRYEVEPAKGISNARNRILELASGEWLALIDDDEVADSRWIVTLFDCAQKYRADAIVGSVLPKFEVPPPAWIVTGRIFDYDLPPAGTPVQIGDALSGNAFLNSGFLKTHGIRFDSAFNATGGEDTEFFRNIVAKGGRVISAPESIVHELIGPARMTERYVSSRYLHQGEIFACVSHQYGGSVEQAIVFARTILNIAAAGALTIAHVPFGKDAYCGYYMLLMRNIGRIRYYLGLSQVEMYR